MKLPLSWLSDYVDIRGINYKELADRLVHIGFEVEDIIDAGAGISGVITGKLLSICPHENADKLTVCKVDIAGEKPIQIVTGAKNISVGDIVPVATDGAELPGGKRIASGILRGVVSEGMLCGGSELGVDDTVIRGAEADGILILPKGTKPGVDIKTVLGLNEIVLDISVTANRPDCQSVYGMAREIAAMLGKKCKPLKLTYQTVPTGRPAMLVEVKNPELCSRYTGRIIERVKIAESPEYIRRRLRYAGHKPYNNIVDITNYVLTEVGQPLHAFDLKMIDEKIVVRTADCDEKIRLLDGSDRTLSDQMLVIADNSKPLALAGVMGGEYSGIADDTKAVFLESARFARGNIRHTARALGLKSDASSRYEKGVDYQSIDVGRERALALFYELKVGDILDCGSDTSVPAPKEKVIQTTKEQICGILGLEIPQAKIVKILSALEIKTEIRNHKLVCTVPLYREDIDGYPDLAEEVIRFYGYGNIRPTMFRSGAAAVGGYSERDQRIREIKSMMVSHGIFEAITYSFVNPKQLDKLCVPNDSPLRNMIGIMNPLSEDYAAMRTQLSGGMLSAVRLNLSRRNEAMRLFEVSRVFIAEDGLPPKKLPGENETLSLAFIGADEDFYTLKTVVTELLNHFKFDYKLDYSDCPWLHPGISAKIECGSDEPIGHFGKIHPSVAKNFDIPSNVFLAEICLEQLIRSTMSNIIYQPLPKFPSVDRDLAIVVKDEILVGDLSDCILSASGGLCEEVKLFDIYKGSQIEPGCKSIAFSIRLRWGEGTLDEKKIQAAMQSIISALDQQFGAKLRV